MNIYREHDYGPVRGYEMGYGPVGRPLMNVFFFYINGIVIDTGQTRMAGAFRGFLSGKKIGAILLTHHHEDHSGNAAEAAEITGAPVLGHPLTIEKMEKGFPIMPYQKMVWGRSKTLKMGQLPGRIPCGEWTMEPIHTPGHSKDHTVFLVKETGWLFSGDLFLGTRIKYFRADEVMADTIESLKKIGRLDFDGLFCAHNPQPSGGKRLVREKLGFLEDFYGQVEELSTRGHNAREIMKGMSKKEIMFVKLFTFGNVSVENMVRSALKTLRHGEV